MGRRRAMYARNAGTRRPIWPSSSSTLVVIAITLIAALALVGTRESAWVARELRSLNVSEASDLAVALFACIALLVGIHQIFISREVSALSAYESYHLACLEHPDLSCGRVDWRRCGEQRRECYTTFVLFALMTGERVIKLFPRDRTWIHAVKDDIRIHRDIIASESFRSYRENQYWRICRLIEEVLSEPISDA